MKRAKDDEIKSGDVIIILETETENGEGEDESNNNDVNQSSEKEEQQEEENEEPDEQEASEEEQSTDTETDKDKQETAPAAPLAKKFARELGINISDLKTDDPDQRITREDVFEYAKSLIQQGAGNEKTAGKTAEITLPDFSKWGDVEKEPLSVI